MVDSQFTYVECQNCNFTLSWVVEIAILPYPGLSDSQLGIKLPVRILSSIGGGGGRGLQIKMECPIVLGLMLCAS